MIRTARVFAYGRTIWINGDDIMVAGSSWVPVEFGFFGPIIAVEYKSRPERKYIKKQIKTKNYSRVYVCTCGQEAHKINSYFVCEHCATRSETAQEGFRFG